MDEQTIALIIKWGPLALVASVFLFYFIKGIIKGTYKVTRRLIYVLLYVVLTFIFIDNITSFLLDLKLDFVDFPGARTYIVDFVENNDTVNKFFAYSPDLKSLIVDHPEIILSPIVFLILVLIVLPFSFPLYWIYVLI